MRKLARKLIDAVQHSRLGSLTRPLLIIGWLALLITDHLGDPFAYGSISLALMGTLVIATAMIWATGQVAIRRPRSTSQLHRLQEEPPIGFEVWGELPIGGLKPPAIIRSIVTRLGAPPGTESSWLELISYCATLILITGLAFIGSDIWQRVYPPLAAPSARLLAAWFCLAILAVFTIRMWASTERKRLASQ